MCDPTFTSREVSTQMTTPNGPITIRVRELAEPLSDLVVSIYAPSQVHKAILAATDSRGIIYARKALTFRNGSARTRFPVKGAPGKHTIEVIYAGSSSPAKAHFTLIARTRLESDDEALNTLFQRLQQIVAGDESTFHLEGGEVRCNPTWVRDHIHEMKAYKFWAKDLKSFLDLLFRHQMPSGAFHEMIMPETDGHATFVHPEFVYHNAKDKVNYIRLELEADIEYLMVEGAYQVWQATGDDAWLRAHIERLEQGMQWAMTDPRRWEPRYGLVKRPFTIDTWDFTYGLPDSNRKVEPDTPMAIMHGDNSGMYAACRSLARMWQALGKEDRVRYWTQKAEHFRKATNRVCWNGKFYTHQVHLPPSQGVPGVAEKEILSLSNPYDINRGLPDHRQAISILNEYRARREKLKSEYICEWFSIHPPYPQFIQYKAGQYANGAIFPLVGGELCKAAFQHEMPGYALETLQQCGEMVEKYGTLPFALSPKGEVQGGGPTGWGAAAFYSAIVEGLAGVSDRTTRFLKVVLSPRWAAKPCLQVKLVAAYGPSDSYVAYRYAYDPAAGRIDMDIAGSAEEIHAHVLLPGDAEASEVRAHGRRIPFRTVMADASRYADFTLDPKLMAGTGSAKVVIRCRRK